MDEFELRIDVQIQPKNYGGSGLRVTETLEVNAGSFLDLCKVLGQFHDLAENIRANKRKA